MSFEIIDTPATEPEVKPEETTDDVTTDASSTVPDSDDKGDGTTEQPEDAGGTETGTPEDDGKEDTTPSDEPASYFFGGEEVEIEIPEDVDAALKEKGLDASKVAAELYAKEGEFSLSDETKQKLYDAFGKFAVDAYLSGLKATNEGFMHRHAESIKEAEAADAQRFTDISNECGGEEGWGRLEQWALEALSDDELTAFNAVMESGNQYLQQYAVRELEGRRKAAQGDDKVELVEASAPAQADADNGPLTREAYIRATAEIGRTFGNDRKAAAEAQAKLDARRRAGMAAGL